MAQGGTAGFEKEMRQMAAWMGYPWQGHDIVMLHAKYMNGYKRRLMQEAIEKAFDNNRLGVDDPQYISYTDLVEFSQVPRTALTLHKEMNENGYHVELVDKDASFYMEKAIIDFEAARKTLVGDTTSVIKASNRLYLAEKALGSLADLTVGGCAKRNHVNSQSLQDNLVESFGGQDLKWNPYGDIPVTPIPVYTFESSDVRTLYHCHNRQPAKLGSGGFGSVTMAVLNGEVAFARKSEGFVVQECGCAELDLDSCPHITEELQRIEQKAAWECCVQALLQYHGASVPDVGGFIKDTSSFLMEPFLMKVGPFCPQARFFYTKPGVAGDIEWEPEGYSSRPSTLLNFLLYPSEKRNSMKPSDFIEALLGLVDTLLMLHAVKLVHCDVKLNNIFVVLDHPSGKVKFALGDLGCAKGIGKTGQRMGTIQDRHKFCWLPAEVVTGQYDVIPKVDVFSVARLAMESAEILDWHADTSFTAAQLKAGMGDLVWLATPDLPGQRCDMMRVRFEIEKWLEIQRVVQRFG